PPQIQSSQVQQPQLMLSPHPLLQVPLLVLLSLLPPQHSWAFGLQMF
ncbi:15494_t:CDS:1, partial [Racocetra persica]